MIPRNRQIKTVQPGGADRKVSTEFAPATEERWVRDIDFHFVDGTIYSPTLEDEDSFDLKADTFMITCRSGRFPEVVLINKINVCRMSIRRVKRLMPTKLYVSQADTPPTQGTDHIQRVNDLSQQLLDTCFQADADTPSGAQEPQL